MNSPFYTRFQESPARETRIFLKFYPSPSPVAFIPYLPAPIVDSDVGRDGIRCTETILALACAVKVRCCTGTRPRGQFQSDGKNFWFSVKLLQIQSAKSS